MKHPSIQAFLSALILFASGASAPASTENTTRRTLPIDDSLFVASGSDLRSIEVVKVMNASPELIWDAWTTEEGWKSVYGAGRPEVVANIELAPGGLYEWLFDGEIGSNGCQVLSYLPPRMLSFSWNAPVTQPLSRAKRTWMVIEIEPVQEGQSLVRATQMGFGEEPHWDETHEYFQQAWAHVLDTMAAAFEQQE